MPKRTDGAAPLPRGKPPPENEAAAKRTEIQAADEDSKQDDRITFTLFPDVGAQTKTEYRVSWDGLAAHVRSPGEFAVKAKCPLIKLARFGERRSEKNSLRHDANMIEITGIEGDYDGERLSVGEATMLLADADVEAVIYSSPSYTPDAPRWRVLAPFSKPYPPGERRRFMARLQGALAGILAPESSRYRSRITSAK